jgi:hypothetical protein
MRKMFGKKKIKLCDFDGRKIDTAIVTNEDDIKKTLKRWKLKGLM